jgi:UDP-N-acetylglucosamine 2-epimerase
MQDYLATSPLPAHVVTHRFDAVDVQEVIARSAVLVSDYSSLAMEAALLTHPVVYYQFDRDTYYSGRRLHRPGDWSFERNGFGPVTETVEQAVTALELIAETGEVDPMYLARMQAAFPFRDGRCCERIVAATLHVAHRVRDPAGLPSTRTGRAVRPDRTGPEGRRQAGGPRRPA